MKSGQIRQRYKTALKHVGNGLNIRCKAADADDDAPIVSTVHVYGTRCPSLPGPTTGIFRDRPHTLRTNEME